MRIIMRSVLFIGVMLIASVACGQQVTLSEIISLAEANSNIESDTIDLCSYYILEGELVSFKNHKESTLQDIKYAAITSLSDGIFCSPPCEYVMVVGTGSQQSRSAKKKELDLIRENLNIHLPKIIIKDFVCNECKQVVIDGYTFTQYEAKEIVNQLKLREIEYIDSYPTAKQSIYGRNAVNGLTTIYLKK